MNNGKIFAGVVLYDPDLVRLQNNIGKLLPQVEAVLLVDNGSANIEEIEEKYSDVEQICLIKNKENLGIAKALNQILDWGTKNDFTWCLTMDQDSYAESDMVSLLAKCFSKPKLAIVCPKIEDINLKTQEHALGIQEIKAAADVITSGSCINVKIAEKIGGYDERLFIDYVDTDFQERILRSGYVIIRNNDAVLHHEVGHIKVHEFLGRKIICSNHSPMRRYYMVRNRLYYQRKYYGWKGCLKEKIRLILGTIKILIYEEKGIEKAKESIKGFRDYKKLLKGNTESGFGDRKNLNISIILPSFQGTGGISVLYEYGRRLKARGHRVTYYTPIIGYNLHRSHAVMDFAKQIYATFKMFYWIYIRKYVDDVRKSMDADIQTVWSINDFSIRDGDIVIASAWCTAFDVAKLSSSKGEKIYFVQDYEVWDNRKWVQKSYQLPLKKIVIADWIKKCLAEECGCEENEIVVINNGIDTKVYNNTNKKYKYGKEKVIECLMLSHTLPRKGVQNGIKAFALARKQCPNMKLRMFGIKKPKEIPDWIEFYVNPKQEQIVHLYRISDIFIFPSLEEGWGLTPVEAMACKCAVVGTRTGCMLSIGKDGDNVLLTDPGDIKEMADQIVRLAENDKLRESISEMGWMTVQNMDWEIAADRLEQFLMNMQ